MRPLSPRKERTWQWTEIPAHPRRKAAIDTRPVRDPSPVRAATPEESSKSPVRSLWAQASVKPRGEKIRPSSLAKAGRSPERKQSRRMTVKQTTKAQMLRVDVTAPDTAPVKAEVTRWAAMGEETRRFDG